MKTENFKQLCKAVSGILLFSWLRPSFFFFSFLFFSPQLTWTILTAAGSIRQFQFYWAVVGKKLGSLKGQQREPEGKEICVSCHKPWWWYPGKVKCVNVSIWSSFSSFSLFQEIQSRRRTNLFLVLENHRIFPVTKIFKKYCKYKCPSIPREGKKKKKNQPKKYPVRKAGKRKEILLRLVIQDISVEKESVSNT